MRSALIILAVCLAAPTSVAVASPSPSAPSARTERGVQPRPATEAELERYAAREQKASKLARFEGGRRGGAIATSTVIIILLVAILVVLII